MSALTQKGSWSTRPAPGRLRSMGPQDQGNPPRPPAPRGLIMTRRRVLLALHAEHLRALNPITPSPQASGYNCTGNFCSGNACTGGGCTGSFCSGGCRTQASCRGRC